MNPTWQEEINRVAQIVELALADDMPQPTHLTVTLAYQTLDDAHAAAEAISAADLVSSHGGERGLVRWATDPNPISSLVHDLRQRATRAA